jgi:AcrR family transcriptional regulator
LGISERRQREREARREQILRAAVEVFAERGLEGASMEAVAERAELGKASLYYYFPTKQALLDAVLEAGAERFSGELAAVRAPEGGLPEALQALLVFHLHFFQENAELMPVLAPLMAHMQHAASPATARAAPPLPDGLATAMHSYQAQLADLLTGTPWAERPGDFRGFLSDITVVVFQLCRAGRHEEAAARIEFYVDLVRGRLAAEPEQP